MKISTCMILGNVGENCYPALMAAEKFSDEIVLLITKDSSDSRTYKAVNKFAMSSKSKIRIEVDLSMLYEDGILKSFADARNKCFSLATGEILFWLDSDDDLFFGKDPKEFKDLILDHFENKKIDGIFCEYDYEVTESGLCLTRQNRERFTRKGNWEWRSPIHEVQCALKPCNIMFMSRDIFHVKHLRPVDKDTCATQNRRNRLIVERFFKDNPDYEVRLDFYYGHMLFEDGEYHNAINSYAAYLVESGYKDERYIAHLRIAACNRKLGRHGLAIKACFDAIDESPLYPEAYSDLAESYTEYKDWDKVVYWCNIAKDRFKECPKHGGVWNPTGMKTRPMYLARQACIEKGDFNAALGWNTQLQIEFPGDPILENTQKLLMREIEFLNDVKIRVHEFSKLSEPERYEYVKKLPVDFLSHGLFAKYADIHTSGRKRIAFFCGEAPQPWGPSSISKGIGGSEEAVINLSREMAKLGWDVEVFCNTTELGLKDGVHWREWMGFNLNTEYDVVVYWRAPEFAKIPFKAKRKYIWLHDLQVKEKWTDDVINSVDGVFVLSKFHRESVPYIPDDKIWITGNGIDLGLVFDGSNAPTRCIYASSPDRGLERVLDAWPMIKKAVPEAELSIFYGFTPAFEKLCQEQPEKLKWKETMLQKMKQSGVTFHGMVSQERLGKEFAEHGIWVYPTCFGEISCITAMKAQANGAIPVVSRYSAINETVIAGHRCGPEGRAEWESKDLTEWAEAVIREMQNPSRIQRKSMKTDARDLFSWTKIAQSWDNKFKEDLGERLRESVASDTGES